MKIRELAKSNPEVKRWNDLAMAVVEGGLTDEEWQEFWALDAKLRADGILPKKLK